MSKLLQLAVVLPVGLGQELQQVAKVERGEADDEHSQVGGDDVDGLVLLRTAAGVDSPRQSTDHVTSAVRNDDEWQQVADHVQRQDEGEWQWFL